jgi:hypothetical protein
MADSKNRELTHEDVLSSSMGRGESLTSIIMSRRQTPLQFKKGKAFRSRAWLLMPIQGECYPWKRRGII